MQNKYLEQYKNENLRRVQLKMLDMLQQIADICDRHDIPYWLDGGTLLGAARHQGFIPWDDDIDISMRQADLKRFLEIAPNELPPHLILQTAETEPGVKMNTYKVRDLNSFFADADDFNRAPYQRGLFIDIAPFIPYPSHFRHLGQKVARSLCIMDFKLHSPHYYNLRSAAELIYFGVKRCIFRLVWKALRPFARDGKYTCSIPNYNWYGALYRTDDIFPLGTIEFEGRTFKAPCHVDAYLQCIYHDWQQLPPPEKRVVHSLFFLPELIETPHATSYESADC